MKERAGDQHVNPSSAEKGESYKLAAIIRGCLMASDSVFGADG